MPAPVAAQTAPMKFGMDVGAVEPMKAWGTKPDYATMWVGVWTLKSGWGGIDAQLDNMYNSGVTPVIHFYYWGNDISKNCLENGCWSTVHNSWKDKNGWQQLAQGLEDHLNARMKGRAVVIVLETEFNKNDAATYEALDGYLMQKAQFFESQYPASEVALGFGNWGSNNWGIFDRAAGASTYVGTQGMKGSTRDSVTSYTGMVGSLLTSVKTLKGQFGKPVFITDIALSSHWEPEWLKHQATTIQSLMDRRGEFKSAGAVAMMYRGLYDAPNANTNEYYGEGERHFGMAWSGNRSWKPAMHVWFEGIKAERGSPSYGSSSSASAFTATFNVPPNNVNEWWVQVAVKAPSTVTGVTASVNGGSPVALGRQSWGDWGKSIHATRGSQVVFKATNAEGQVATSQAFTWLSSTSSSAPSTFSATFAPRAVGNDWWIEVYITSGKTVSKVEANVNNAGYKTLDRTNWGTWAKSLHAPNGSHVVFRATDSSGATATSSTYTW